MPNDTDDRSDLTKSLHRSTASYELAFAPVLLALAGLWLDKWIGTVPLFTLLFAVVGIGGSFAKAYYTYGRDMAALRESAPWRSDAAVGERP